LQLLGELIVHQTHYVFFMLITHTIEEQWPGHAQLQAHPKPAS
jgi:hypothetical protein